MAEDEDKNWGIVILKFMAFYWRGMFIIIWPIFSLIVFVISFEKKIRCLYVVMLMAGYWVTEAIPLPVTGMIPIVLFPLLDVQSTEKTALNYLNKTNFILMGSIFIALGIEYCGLHKRIAYCAIMCVGCSPRRLHFGLTFVTSLLSMFLLNSACTAMMCPIIEAVLLELETQGVGSMYKPKLPTEDRPRPSNITIAYFLSAAFGSTIGGIGTLVGTGTNLAFKGLYDTDEYSVDFIPWMLFNAPLVLLLSFFCWLSLEFIFMGLYRPKSEDGLIVAQANEHADAAKLVMRTKMDELGPFLWNEIIVLLLFILCVIFWIFRSPKFMTGWGDLYGEKFIADATPAIVVLVMFAIIPSSYAFFSFCTKDKTARPVKTSSPLVPWNFLQQKFPWGLLFLIGGGFALADGGKESKLTVFLGEQLGAMRDLNPILVLAITSFFAEWATELTSNVAICNVVMPVLLETSKAMNVHALDFTVPAAVMCSFAFLLPVGTPPNGMVSEYCNMRTTDMVKGGILLKVFAWLVYLVLFPSYGKRIFKA